MNYLVLWVKYGFLRASKFVELPENFEFESRRFEPTKFYFGDVDYLRNEKRQLVGFAYTTGNIKQELVLSERLVQRCRNIRIKDGSLLLFLKESEFEFQNVQAIGTEIYFDNAGDCIVAVPDWGFGELAFDLASDELPVPLDIDNM